MKLLPTSELFHVIDGSNREWTVAQLRDRQIKMSPSGKHYCGHYYLDMLVRFGNLKSRERKNGETVYYATDLAEYRRAQILNDARNLLLHAFGFPE